MKLSKYQGDSRVSFRPSSSLSAKMSISREISEREISRRIDRVFLIQQLAFLREEDEKWPTSPSFSCSNVAKLSIFAKVIYRIL